MNFLQLNYLPALVVIFLVIAFIVIKSESTFFQFVRKYWFYRRSTFHYLSSLSFLLGVAALLASLLDIRGPEEKIKTEVPTERTIILIDTSASMLAEDVKPSRLQKAALIAKHFARKAVGQQISVVAFAEVQKKIVPFTNDLDLIDARLDSLKELRNQYGSSALSIAIQESIQYFRETDGEARGNILVLTDGEETSEGIDLKVPKDIHVALVGVGTEQGGRIPLDDGRGFRFGYKKDRGQDVITKLNENFFKRVTSDIPSSKYWLANSFSLPSEEIIDFFRAEKIKGNGQQDMVIRPVLMEWIVIPAILFLVLSYILKWIKIFSLGLLLILPVAYSQDQEEPKLTPEIISRMQELQSGELNQVQKLKLADDLYRAGAKSEAMSLYEENLPAKLKEGLPPEAYLNYGTSLLESGKMSEGLKVYESLSKDLDNSDGADKIRETMNKNVVAAFKKQEEKKQQEKKKQDSKDNKENKKDDQSGQGSQKDQQSGSGKQDDKQQKDKKEENKEKNENKKEDKNQGEEDKDKPDDEDKDKDEKENQPQEPKDLPPKKLPAKLKQLMSDDRQLQMKMIENGTKDLNRRKSRKSKDW